MRVDGKAIAHTIFEDLTKRVGELQKKNLPAGRQGITPHVVIILVGDDPASASYVRQKELKTQEIGAQATIVRLPADISETELLLEIEQHNNNENVHGIIVQRPLPQHIDSEKVNQAVTPIKDIDAFRNDSPYQMPLAAAVVEIIKSILSENIEEWLKNHAVVVVGKGETGGGPTIELLKSLGANPSVIDSKTQNPEQLTLNADLIVSTVGKQNIIKPENLKKEVILIGVGMYRGDDGKLHADYNEEEIKDIASWYTPVPGGVGPVNVAMLLKNLVLAAENR